VADPATARQNEPAAPRARPDLPRAPQGTGRARRRREHRGGTLLARRGRWIRSVWNPGAAHGEGDRRVAAGDLRGEVGRGGAPRGHVAEGRGGGRGQGP